MKDYMIPILFSIFLMLLLYGFLTFYPYQNDNDCEQHIYTYIKNDIEVVSEHCVDGNEYDYCRDENNKWVKVQDFNVSCIS